MTIIIGGFIYLFYSRSQPRPQSVLSPLKGALTWVERCVGFKCNWFLSIDLSTISHDYVWNIFYFDCLSIRVRHAVIQTWLLEITSFIWWYKSKEVQSQGGEILFRHFSLFFFFFSFFRNATPLCGKQQTNIHIFLMSKSVRAFRVLWYFFPPLAHIETA